MLSYLQFREGKYTNSVDYLPGEYFEKKNISFDSFSSNEMILKWFDPSNNYPNYIFSELQKGSTLQSVLAKHSNYLQGHDIISENSEVENILIDTRNKKNESFYDVYKKICNSFPKLGNSFVKIIFDETNIFFEYIQPQKCRLLKNGNVEINADWKNYVKDNSVYLPVFPAFTKNKGINESVLHIKNEVDGVDHYGLIDYMSAALLLNEKEYRRNNWQKNQLKNGFKKDFLVLSEKALDESDHKKYNELSKKIGGDQNAGGVFPIQVISDSKNPIVPLNDSFEFDFSKDDTDSQIYALTGFPRSLVGIKSGAAFSVDQIESDYEQYLPIITNMQNTIMSSFDNVFELILNINDSNLKVVNMPPAQIIKTYLPYLNDVQRENLVKQSLSKFGIEL